MLVSPVVSSHASRARLHVNARTQPMRRTNETSTGVPDGTPAGTVSEGR